METFGPIIFEISSDEESDFLDASRGGSGVTEDDAWLSNLFPEVNDDSDDVVFVSEVFANPSKKSRLNFRKPSAGLDDYGDDDECVVLDCDPDKPKLIEINTADDGTRADDDYDDVEIVGQKGEVACRDFPHARHLCAKFPFGLTAHEVHCSQCHCYVCDSIAPCGHWGTGISTRNHCHATDKDAYWALERKKKKEGHKPVPVIHKPSLFPGIPKANPSISCLHPVSSNIRIPKYKTQSNSVSPQLHTSNVTVNNNSRVRVSSRVPLKRPAVAVKRGYEKFNSGSQVPKQPPLARCHSIPIPSQNLHNSSMRLSNISIGMTNSSSLPQPHMPYQQNQSSNYMNPMPYYPYVAPPQQSAGSYQSTQNQTSAAGVSFSYQLPNMGNATIFDNQSFVVNAYNNNNPSSSSLIINAQQSGQSQSDVPSKTNVASMVDFHQKCVAPEDSLDVKVNHFDNDWDDYGLMFGDYSSPGTNYEVPLSPLFSA